MSYVVFVLAGLSLLLAGWLFFAIYALGRASIALRAFLDFLWVDEDGLTIKRGPDEWGPVYTQAAKALGRPDSEPLEFKTSGAHVEVQS